MQEYINAFEKGREKTTQEVHNMKWRERMYSEAVLLCKVVLTGTQMNDLPDALFYQSQMVTYLKSPVRATESSLDVSRSRPKGFSTMTRQLALLK